MHKCKCKCMEMLDRRLAVCNTHHSRWLHHTISEWILPGFFPQQYVLGKHPHFELLGRLANISSIPRSGTETSRLSAWSSMDPGTTNEPTKECSAASPANAGTFVFHTCAVIADLSKSVQDRMSSPFKIVSQIVGSDGGSIPFSSAGCAPYATVSVVG